MPSATTVEDIITQELEAEGHRGIFLLEDLTTQIGVFFVETPNHKKSDYPSSQLNNLRHPVGDAASISLQAMQYRPALRIYSELKLTAVKYIGISKK